MEEEPINEATDSTDNASDLIQLSFAETRVLGSLIEKELTTPEYYPMSLNGLTNACNQKNNRNPKSDLSEEEVGQAIEALRQKN